MSDSDDDGGHPIDQVLQDRTKENKEQEVILIDDSTSDDVELANAADEEAAPAETPASRKKKKKKAKLQDPKTPADALATSAADQAERLVKTAPAALNKPLNAHGILLVEDTREIANNVDLKRLIRAPRYFDDDAGQETAHITLTKRCFNCGQVGHNAMECTNATRQRPCHLCAQLGHEGRDCPNRLCFKCGRPGHLSRDCTSGRVEGWESGLKCCNRCGSESCACAGKGDYFRYEGGCNKPYAAEDLKRCRCYVCGSDGHLACRPTPRVPAARVSCYCCGAEGHLGENCPHENRPHLAAERAGDARRAAQERDAEFARQVAAQAISRYGFGGRGNGGNGGGGARVLRHTRFDDDGNASDDYDAYEAGRMRGQQGGRYEGGGGGNAGGMRRYESAPRLRDDRYEDRSKYEDRRYSGGQQQQYSGQQQYGRQQQQYGSTSRFQDVDPFPRNYGTQQQQYNQQHSYGQQQQLYGQQPMYGQQQQYTQQYQHTAPLYAVQSTQQYNQQYQQYSQQQPRYGSVDRMRPSGGSDGGDYSRGEKRGRYDDYDNYSSRQRPRR